MAATGSHGRQAYVALLFGLHVSGRTGILKLTRGRSWRRLHFARGRPVRYESSLDDEALPKTLVQAGLVKAKPMRRVVGKLRPGESLADELVSLGLLDEDDLVAHKLQRLERGCVAALGWADGSWSFEAFDTAGPSIDPALLPDTHPLRTVWSEVRHRVDMEEAASLVSDPDAGAIQRFGELGPVLEQLGVEGALAALADHLDGTGSAVDDLFRLVQDKSGHLLHLLWFLETVGLLRRTSREPDATLTALARGDLPTDAPPKPAPTPTNGAAARPAARRRSRPGASVPGAPASSPRIGKGALAHLPELLKTARKHRMQKDFYAFLDLTPKATVEEIEQAYKRLVQLWRGAASTASLAEDARKDAHDLVQAALTVWKTLSDGTRREEYDKRLSQGRAPSLDSLLGAAAGTGPKSSSEVKRPGSRAQSSARRQVSKHVRARKLVDTGDFQHAMPLLQQLRLEHPSDPDVLADLGWTTWRIKGVADDNDSAGEYLQIALTFAPTHTRALEFLARIAKERGKDNEARRLVERLLAVDPQSKWGRAAMRTFDAEESGARRGRKRGR